MFKRYSCLSGLLLAPVLLLSAAAVARAQDFAQKRSVSKPAAAFEGHIRFEGHGEGEAGAGASAQTDAQSSKSNGGRQQPQQQPTPRPTPLTGGQKIKRAFRGSFLSPVPYAVALLNGGIRQIGEDRLPHKDTEDELADWGSASARSFTTGTTYRLFGNGFYPALFKQDPRYEPSQKKGFGGRAAHAVSRLFVTRGDNGNLQPNFSRFAGAATSSAMANIWERSTPGHDRIGPDATLKRFGMSFVSGALGNLVREFAGDLFK